MYFYLAGSWSPDLEDGPDAQPDGAKLTYGRDFLLQFQTNPLSMLKPEGLPDIDVVLGQARTPSRSGSQQNRYHSAQQELAVQREPPLQQKKLTSWLKVYQYSCKSD